MIQAEICGKSHVAEDRLSSACFGLLGFLPDFYLIEFFGRAVEKNGRRLDPTPFDYVEHAAFWPWLQSAGQPDMIVQLGRIDGTSDRLTIIIEVKHGSPKSGTASGEEACANSATTGINPVGSAEERTAADQLAKYWIAGKKRYQRLVLVYLTHHRSLPENDIDESLRASGGEAVIFWLSWFHLYDAIMDHLESGRSLQLPERRILKVLTDYLVWQGYVRFRRWRIPNTSPSLDSGLYHHRYALAQTAEPISVLYDRAYASALPSRSNLQALLSFHRRNQ
jgi:hypothetical protein